MPRSMPKFKFPPVKLPGGAGGAATGAVGSGAVGSGLKNNIKNNLGNLGGVRGSSGAAGTGAAGAGAAGSVGKGLDDAAGAGAAGSVGKVDNAAGSVGKGSKGLDGAAGSVDDVGSAAAKKKNKLFALEWKNKGRLTKGAAVVGGLAYASYESIRTSQKLQEEADELVAECLLSCLPQHPNIEKPEAPAICLSEENYNNSALKEWYFPSTNPLNGPDCEENSALCKKPRDCTPNDVRSICKANSLETYKRCSEDCEAKCRRCIPNPTFLKAVVDTASESASVVGGGLGEALGSVAGSLGLSPTIFLAVGLFLIFFLLFK